MSFRWIGRDGPSRAFLIQNVGQVNAFNCRRSDNGRVEHGFPLGCIF